jgi:hypothetical protein
MDWESWPSGSSSFLLCPCGADGPRGRGGRSAGCVFVACSSCSCVPLLSIWFGFRFSLQLVRGRSGTRADGSPGLRGRSVFLGSVLVVLLSLTDGPWPRPDGPCVPCGLSAAHGGLSARPLRTVRPAWPDSPPEANSVVLWFDSFPPSFVLPRVLQGIVPKTWCWSITLLSWRLVCDSIHPLCVTGNCLGYRPGSLRKNFTGSYSLPPL